MTIDAIAYTETLEVTIREGDWKMVLGTFNNEKVSIDSVHFSKDGFTVLVEDDGTSATWNEELEFCAGRQVSVAEFTKRCNKIGLAELTDIHFINHRVELTYENDIFKIGFRNYLKNPFFKKWLTKIVFTFLKGKKPLSIKPGYSWD